MSQIRKIQRSATKKDIEDNDVEVVPVNHLMLPVGKVLSDPVRGEHLTLPLFGWVATRAKEGTPLVMLVLVLLDKETQETKGTLQVELPVFTETEKATLSVLEGYGWDGRVWPENGGWPNGEEAETEYLTDLLAKAQLRNTFVFPPGGSGFTAQTVNVSRAKGPFLMPPLLDPKVEASEERLSVFRELVTNPKMFR